MATKARRQRRAEARAAAKASARPDGSISIGDVRQHMAATTELAKRLATGTDNVALSEYTRILGDQMIASPKTGRMTPKASVTRWDRLALTALDLGHVVGILRRGEEGDAEALVDLWLRMLKTDAHLASVWESLLAPVYSARLEVQPGKRGDPVAAKRFAQACTEALEYVSDPELVLSALLAGAGPGHAVLEKIWKRGELLGQPAWVCDLVPVHARRFRYDDCFELGLYDDGRAVGQLRDAGWEVTELKGRGARIARLPSRKYVCHHPIVGVHDYPSGNGMVHSVARWWWVKQAVTKYWLGGAEVGANPRIIGMIEQTAAGVTMDEFLEQLENLAADGVMVLREGTSVDFKDGGARATGEVWDKLFERMNLAMSKRVLGSTLNVEVSNTGGNRSLGESQNTVTIKPRQQMHAAQMWSSLKRSYFRDLRDFNPHLFAADTALAEGRSVIQDAPLTGAQVTTMLEVLQRAADSRLPRESVVELLVAYGIERAQADRILGEIGKTFTPSPEGGPSAAESAEARGMEPRSATPSLP